MSKKLPRGISRIVPEHPRGEERDTNSESRICSHAYAKRDPYVGVDQEPVQMNDTWQLDFDKASHHLQIGGNNNNNTNPGITLLS